jgi:hypothetical protein
MTKRTLEYIVSHYTAAMAAWNKSCVSHKCKRCPFVNGVYCSRSNYKETDLYLDIKTIRKYLESQKGGKK